MIRVLLPILLLITACEQTAMSRSTASHPIFEVRLVADPQDVEQDPAGFEELPYSNGPSGRLWVRKKAELGISALRGADVLPVKPKSNSQATAARSRARLSSDAASSEVTLQLLFSPEGSARFREVTGKHARHKIAFVIDGTVVAAPVIRSEVIASSMPITVTDEEEAVRLAELLQGAIKPD